MDPAPTPPLDDAHVVVLVEGVSDQRALETLAERRGRRLPAEGVRIVPLHGATNVRRVLDALLPQLVAVRLGGLCDAAEVGYFLRALERTGLGTGLDRAGLAAVGFHVCDADLEDELVRALGVPAVERVLAAEKDLESFRRFQNQPAQRGRDVAQQLRRFLGTRAGRKEHYATALARALDPGQVPPPLDALLRWL